LERAATEIADAGGTSHTAQVDARDEQAVDKRVNAVMDQVGCIDVSFNAIDIADSIHGTPLVELSPEALSLPVMHRVATNFLTARAAARHMVRKGAGVILMITANTGPHGLAIDRQLRDRRRRHRGPVSLAGK
jgi:3-oxoacyl-[acyl-carrier protein] reductase